jgi:adenine-specific DNA-methyltransferase
MYPRLVLLRELLAEDGFIVVHIDDNEGQYLKILLDEVFGRSNFLTTYYVQVRYGNKTLAEDNAFQKIIEYSYIYAKNSRVGKPIRPKNEYTIDKFVWSIEELTQGESVQLSAKHVSIFKPGQYVIKKIPACKTGLKETWATGSLLKQSGSSGEYFDRNIGPRKLIDGLGCLYKVDGIGEDGLGYRYFTGPKKATATKGKFYSGIPLARINEMENGGATKEMPIVTFEDFSGSFGNCRQEGNVDFRSGKKPEAYLKKLLEHFSESGDLVLDSFLGSGSTAATAMKMRRKFIGIEMGAHARTHCLSRLVGVVEGDKTGISEEVSWAGGSGFRFCTLGETAFDEDGRINEGVTFATLAAFIWHFETGVPGTQKFDSPFLGVHNGTAYYLLFNGILGDRKPAGGNVLTRDVLEAIYKTFPQHGPKVGFDQITRLGPARLASEKITFKQIPYDVSLR